MKRKVYFYGELKQKYGDVLELAVDSVSEIVSLMEANFGNFRKTLLNGRYAILRGESIDNFIESLQEDQLTVTYKEGDWHIVPEASGAGGSRTGGLITFLVGAAIATAGYIFTQPWAIQIGVGIALSGISSMLTTVPSGDFSNEKRDEKASLIYTGGVNNVEQGGPIPLVYGQIMAGSIVVSSDIQTFERADREIGQPGEIS